MSVESGPKLRVAKSNRWSSVAGFLATLLVIGLISAIPFAFRAFLFQPFNAPSSSMAPTLVVGDYFFVSKYDYGFGLFPSEPRRGDVVVFRLPRDQSVQYVKRLVGMPGDRVQMIRGALYINGQAVQREPLTPVAIEPGVTAKRWRETLANGVSYETLDLYDAGLLDNTSVYEVPPGNYFMLGDNRDNSTDSRVPITRPGGIGYVPFENLTGRSRIIYFSAQGGRMGTLIH